MIADEKQPLLKPRMRICTLEDVAMHSTAQSCWIARKGRVYDITGFLQDHPGGDDIILKHAGKDVEEIMHDEAEHGHSDAAYDMMESYVIGRLGTTATIVDEAWEPQEDFHPDDTNAEEDFAQCQFLDLGKPLVSQVWDSNWTKAYYLQQVHQPRHLPEPARFFERSYLEVFTRTKWYVVPCVWLPIAAFLFYRSVTQFAGIDAPVFANPLDLPLSSIPVSCYLKTLICFFIGNLIWTFLEYTMHRFIFHVDEYLPDNRVFLTLHFLTHGVHHYLPMDRLRLVMPPVLFTTLSTPFTRLAHVLFPTAIANGIIAGSFTFYVLYDCMHYALHHTKLPEYMREMKKYHLAHHYKNFELGFGVTSKIWDYVFATVLPV
ncbi:fatty acid alpha-hydroxylase [Tulasnella sp. 330]|nr:fatty acid alpha-hydroxylase [Tulasnella sp. 330]KAG8873214.1 fatty acid alpha-hydroxylase [Tulasnella sp. 331]KAG8884549.1 fatty acid alpha-hydroxylase [Tulasnella sp. 332]